MIPVGYDTHFELGDEVLVIGNVEHLLENAPKVGVEIADAEGLGVEMRVARVVVSNASVVGEAVGEIRLDERAHPLDPRAAFGPPRAYRAIESR